MNAGRDLVPSQPADPYARATALAAEFVDTRRARSEHTGDAYRLDLALWLDFCRARNVDPFNAWPNDAQRWSAELAEGDPETGRRPQKATTRNRRLGAVSSWYKWLIRHEVATRNPVAGLLAAERPKSAPRHTPALSDAQAGALLAAADADTPRSAAIVYLLVYTAVRVGELLAADVTDIHMDDGEMKLRVHGKGGADRPVRLNAKVLERVNRWLKTRPDQGPLLPVLVGQAGAGQPRPLIATSTGRRLERKTVRALLKRLARQAGLPAELVDWLAPHSTRATYATSAIRAGLSLRAIQKTMGHQSLKTTAGYDRGEVTAANDPAIRLLDFIHPPQPPGETA